MYFFLYFFKSETTRITYQVGLTTCKLITMPRVSLLQLSFPVTADCRVRRLTYMRPCLVDGQVMFHRPKDGETKTPSQVWSTTGTSCSPYTRQFVPVL